MRRRMGKLLPLFAWGSTLTLLAAIMTIAGYLLVEGMPALDRTLIFGDTPPLAALLLRRPVFGGLLPAIFGTIALVVLAVAWAIPLGVASGIYLAEYATTTAKRLLDPAFDILAGLPSIVVGLFGFAVTVFLNRHFSAALHPCLLVSSLALAFLVLPYIIRTTQTALEELPPAIRMTGPALGASRLQNIRMVLLPQALPGIASGVILAIGRCAEDTAVIMLTGAVAAAGVPRSLLSQYEALPFYIYYISAQYTDAKELATGYGAALILLAICLALFGLAFWIRKGLDRRALAHF